MSNAPPAKRSLPYVVVDVFTRTALTGNQLAVFLDGRELSDAEMQALARETRLSETTFILPRDPATERRDGVKVRIFTVQEELPFAGHPTLGTAFVLQRNLVGLSETSVVELDLRAGKIPVTFNVRPGEPEFGEMLQRDPKFGRTHDRIAVAKAVGVAPEDLHPSLPIQTVSTGSAFAIVPMRSVEALRKLRSNWEASRAYLGKGDARFFYFVAREKAAGPVWHARMLFYNGEDPATGSAAGCFAEWMVRHGVADDDEEITIEQGAQVNRPSHIFVRARNQGDQVVDVRVGGHVVEVARGTFFL